MGRIFFFWMVLCVPLIAGAEPPHPRMKLLFLGQDAGANPDLEQPVDLPTIRIDSLPPVEAAQQTVFAARLRSSPVSSFVAAPSPDNAEFEQFFLVAEVSLATRAEAHAILLDGAEFGLTEFAERVSALVDAFNPKHRRVGLIHLADPDDVFPVAIAEVQTALTETGFDLVVVMITDGTRACDPGEALHYSLTSGLADRAPFGDGDGIATAAEVETYLTNALNRQTKRGCGPRYSVLLKSTNAGDSEVIAYSGRTTLPEMEARLYRETFEAEFLLASDTADDVRAFLASCLYCPHEQALTDRVRDMEDYTRAAALEAEIWQTIQNDADTVRLEIYLDTCVLCLHRDAIEARIDTLTRKAAARDAEALAVSQAIQSRDLTALRRYAETCIACDTVDEARALIAEIEADAAYRAEIAERDIAIEAEDVVLLKAFLNECAFCDGRDQAESTLDRVTRRVRLVEPCLAAAAVPQMGGPRHLRQIDQAAASRSCEAADAAFPGDGEIAVALGRIAQAAGDFTRAAAHYEMGMEAKVAAAFGLAAYTHYAPPEGVDIDLVEAERLAQIGATKGDWLSREILTVLYAQGLVPGRTATEAFDIAKGLANEGNAIAEFFLGQYYLDGTGVAPDRSEAERWLTKAVDQGYLLAMSYLAEVYETADIPNIERAAALYWTALKAGDATALDRLTTELSGRNREVIRQIQQKLNAEGAYRGPLDGIAGPGTVAAIQSYVANGVSEG